MTRPLSSRFAAAAVLAAAALGAATAVQAHTEIFFSVGIPGRTVYVEPPPVYVWQQPVYVQPQPVYEQPRPIYVQPPAYGYERPWGPSYADGFERERAWRQAEWQRHQGEYRHHGKWDRHPSHGRDRD